MPPSPTVQPLRFIGLIEPGLGSVGSDVERRGRALVAALAVVAVITPTTLSHATEPVQKSDGTFDTSFLSGTGANGGINALRVDADGNILVLGSNFTDFNQVASSRIARLLPDGSRDTSFDVGTGLNTGGQLNSAITFDSGKVLVGGEFSTFQNVSASRIVQLLPSGALDTSFTISPAPNQVVASLVALPDGNIVAGGNFTTPHGRLMKLGPTGTVDPVFGQTVDGTGTAKGFNSTVLAVATQAGGKLLVGGQFTQFQDETLGSSLVRLNADGTLDAQFGTNLGTAANSIVRAIRVQADGKILVGGNFTGGLKRLNPDGTVDTAFDANLGSGFNSRINSIDLTSDNYIYASGNFTELDGSSAVRVARLNSDGTPDPTFSTGLGADSTVSSVHALPNGDVLIAGFFTQYDGRPTSSANPQPNRIARLTSMSLGPTTQTVPVGIDEAITTQTMTVVATSTVTYSISPALPSGFSLNTATGVVSGTSSDPVPAVDYTITATDLRGRTTTASLSLGNQPSPPPTTAPRSSSGKSDSEADLLAEQPALAATGAEPLMPVLAGLALTAAGIGVYRARRHHTHSHS
jgi:uncharacterized delta-60 repeat protein